ncbi:alpha-galactosidase [Lacticaseibacillus suihuaensis]
MIEFDSQKQQFHLYNDQISYVMEVLPGGYLVHVYSGKRIRRFAQSQPYPHDGRSSFSPNVPDKRLQGFTLDLWPQEYPGDGAGDYRETAFEFTYADGTNATTLTYDHHEIVAGKPRLTGLPATYVEDDSEAQTLNITLKDALRHVAVVLSYTIYADRNVVTRTARVENEGDTLIRLNKVMSGCFDFTDSDYDMIQLPGAWANEKQLRRDHLAAGIHVLDSKRGASSVAQQPFIALCSPNTDEFQGEVHAFHFVYSGNFRIAAEVDAFDQTRVLAGINPYEFEWQLEPGTSFQAPELVYVYSDKGLNGMSNTFHHLYRERLAHGQYRDAQRPILANNWETTYFNFNEDKLVDLIDNAHKLGVELFVLDDGWFKKRNSDTTSLGDWQVDRDKLPQGLAGVAKAAVDRGMQFGLWFEPEMISEDSDLFRAHPDWHVHVAGYPSSRGRNQLVLDFSRPEVREEIFRQMAAILDELPITYVKWDFNRNLTEVASVGRAAAHQKETAHRYILGLYDFLEKLTARYPQILFENCSGGAGRFDPAMCYYMPQSWASDNTDAIARLKIQYGTSLLYPASMICAHVSESPNQQVGRITDLSTRFATAASGNLGIMLDLGQKDRTDLPEVAAGIKFYKAHRQLIQFGDFYRLLSPYETNDCAWMFVSPDRKDALLFFFQILNSASRPHVKLRLCGLDPAATYEIDGQQLPGDELMNYGLFIDAGINHDFQARVLTLHQVN